MPAYVLAWCWTVARLVRKAYNCYIPSGQDVKHGGSMQRCSAKHRHEFIQTLLLHLDQSGNWSWFKDGQPFAEKLMRYGATLGRLAEEQCNGYQDYQGNWDEKATKASERKEERIRAKVIELCKQFGCTPVFQGDPRGNVLKIQVPDGYTNDWGREGICVPTS